MSRIAIFPPVVELYPNDRQIFEAQAVPAPPLWVLVTALGDIQSDSSLLIDGTQSVVDASGGQQLMSGIGVIELRVDDQCRPTSTNNLTIAAFVRDTVGFQYVYSLRIAATTVKVFNEVGTEIFTVSYSTVSGDVYRIELNAGFRSFRNGVLLHARVGLATQIVYPMFYSIGIAEPVALDPARIPAPRLIGDWRVVPFVFFTTPSHGSLTSTGPGTKTEYYGGTIPGTYTLTGAMEAAADATGVQRAAATITIPPLKILGPTEVTLQPGQKTRFKTNYDAAQSGTLIAWLVVSGSGSFSQGEFTAGATHGTTVVRATAAVNSQVADIIITVAALITNASNFIAAKPSEQIDFNHNLSLFPRFVARGAESVGVGNVFPTIPPSYQVNDILVLVVETANEAVSAPAGWTALGDSPQGTGTAAGAAATRLTIFWRRATSTETTPTITDPGDHAIACIFAFRGCFESSSPIDVTAGDVAASAVTGVSIPTDTTVAANNLIILAVAYATDTAIAQVSGFTNANLTNLIEIADLPTTEGNGGGFAVAVGEKAAAGSYGATTATLATASVQGRISFSLTPAPIVWSANIGSINSSSGIWTAPSLAGQIAKITVTNGTLTLTIEVPVLQVFPYTPTARWVWDRKRSRLMAEAEDGTRTGRIKSANGTPFEDFEFQFLNRELAELVAVQAFWDEHDTTRQWIFDDGIRTIRLVGYFDSDIHVEAGGGCEIDYSFRFRGRRV